MSTRLPQEALVMKIATGHNGKSTAAKAESSPPEMRSSAARRILLVEDNAVAARQLKQLLDKAPIQVDIVSDGAAAIHELALRDYAVVLTDLRMPRMDGMDLIREIQKRRLSVTIIVTTGHG